MADRKFLKVVLAAGLALAASASVPALAQDAPVKIGYAIARTGPWAAGAQISQEPNYLMWAEQVNAAGGLSVKGKKRKVELVGFDDRSEAETMVRTYEKLMTSDKVDLILAPWGTGANFAVMPLVQKHGYPMLAPTATGRKLLEMKNPYFFALLQQPDVMMVALAGRAAEIKEFGEASSGVANDLHTATTIAAELVGMLGASDSLLSLDAAQTTPNGNLVQL